MMEQSRRGPAPLVLVADDDRQLRRLMHAALEQSAMRVVEANTGADALSIAASSNPDVIVLDATLPDRDALVLTRALREWTQAPVVVVSPEVDEPTKVAVLDAGADDVVIKPFGTAEFLARVRVWLRRTSQAGGNDGATVLRVGDLQIDLARRIVSAAGKEVHLTRIEYKLFSMLIRHAGKVLTHEQLLVAVWGEACRREPQYLRVYMAALRAKLERDPKAPKYLVTEQGIGYRMRTE